MNTIAVILVAAGRGSRAGHGLPKQYRAVAGKALIYHTISALQQSLLGVHIQPVIHADDHALYSEATAGLTLASPVVGGETRQASVFSGLQALEGNGYSYVLVHDAARPFVTAALCQNICAKLKAGTKAVIPAVAVVDTLKRVEDSIIANTVDRDQLYAVQTPQGFCYASLFGAHEATAGAALTDDGAVMEAAGYRAEICVGSEGNFKVTTASDLNRAEAHIFQRTADVRVGSGYDVHRFTDGDTVRLCGVNIPHTHALQGHSDADVGMHALTDALLAAIAEGDIGTHFPPSDNQWRGAESHIFLEHAVRLVHDHGGIIAHVTVCLICEQPKIGPHMDTMRGRLAEILQIDISRVSVQATTTEKLGFTGRKEGIAAQATATVRLPFAQ